SQQMGCLPGILEEAGRGNAAGPRDAVLPGPAADQGTEPRAGAGGLREAAGAGPVACGSAPDPGALPRQAGEEGGGRGRPEEGGGTGDAGPRCVPRTVRALRGVKVWPGGEGSG